MNTIDNNVSKQITISDQVSPQESLLELSKGFVISQCIFTAAKIGIADLLSCGERHCDDLANATQSDSEVLYSLLKVLASMGIFAETEPKYFKLTPMAEPLLDHGPLSLRNFILLRAEQDYQCWGNLMHTLKTGKSAFEHLYGMNRYQYNQNNPEAAKRFDASMGELARMVNASIVAAYDFSSVKKIIDIGGGEGGLLTGVVKANPALYGILFDQPHTIETAGDLIERRGVGDRCKTIAGDFFNFIPAGADIYMLKNVLHNWSDEKALKILQNCNIAMRANRDGKLLVIERVESLNSSLKSRLISMNMRVMLSSGRVRTKDELEKLLERGGFKMVRIIPTETELSIIEADLLQNL